jgi:hypothetical protein
MQFSSVRRCFSVRGKSPTRNGIESAATLAAIILILDGPRAASGWPLAEGTLAMAAVGFALGFGLTLYIGRRAPRGSR